MKADEKPIYANKELAALKNALIKKGVISDNEIKAEKDKLNK